MTQTPTCQIFYLANEGVGSTHERVPEAAVYEIKSALEIGISRKGYAWSHWNSKANGTGTAYAAGETIVVDENLQLYAQWAPGYEVPDNPTYNPGIRKIQDSDPVRASTVVNPVLAQMIENTAAVKVRAEETAAELKTAVEKLAEEAGGMEDSKGQPGGLATLNEDGKVPAEQLPPLDYDSAGSADTVQKNLTDHENDNSNPHRVTAAQTGAIPTGQKGTAGGVASLGSDGKVPAAQLPAMDYDAKGAAAAVQSNLDSHKADTGLHTTATMQTKWDNHEASKSNPHSVTKAQIGLGNVDNTSDLEKPVSTAVQAAIDKAFAGAGSVPTNHATTNTTYGVGNSTNYGHVRLSDSTSATTGVTGGTAATPNAVKSAYDLAKAAIPVTQKGAASGVASLGTDGKVPAAQLPAMNYDTKGAAAAVQTDLNTHKTDGNLHVTAAKQTKWDGAAQDATDAKSAASNAQTTANTAKTTADAALPKTGGTMTGQLTAASTAPTTQAVRNSYAGTADMISGSSTLATGVVYYVYE